MSIEKHHNGLMVKMIKPAYDKTIKIENKEIGKNHPTYFIADIGANHDGSIDRAKELIYKCAEAGADAAKFQHFSAKTIVSDKGFKTLDASHLSHQSGWKKSVYEVYEGASLDLQWDSELKSTCDKAGVAYMTSPYAQDLVDHVDEFVSAYKIGSGDITWIENIKYIASKGKPVILACGASTTDDVIRAVDAVLQENTQLAILQCNTNYTGNESNFDYINLNYLRTLNSLYPDAILGLSDHTAGYTTAVGAVALGGRVIEKHFTDDNTRSGPDHAFAMTPSSWRAMVNVTRELERSLGTGIKKVEDNEKDTVIIQRRCLRAKRDLAIGEKLSKRDVEVLRPCPQGALEPWMLDSFLDRKLTRQVTKGVHFTGNEFE